MIKLRKYKVHDFFWTEKGVAELVAIFPGSDSLENSYDFIINNELRIYSEDGTIRNKKVKNYDILFHIKPEDNPEYFL